jgi:hypothetical protein
MFQLVCTQDFADYKKGDVITDDAAIAGALASHALHVVKIAAPVPAPDDAPAKGK